MPNYQQGKIYRLVCNNTNKQYIGSTTQKYLCSRLSQHKLQSSRCISKEIINNGNYSIILVENYPCNCKDELLKRERYFIETLQCINKRIPSRTKKEGDKEYQEKNKESIKKRKAEYYQKNKEKIKQKSNDYYHMNK